MSDEKVVGRAGIDTTEFKSSIAAMNRELRVLESGFKASAAGLGDWANDATGLESRIKTLNSQIDIQKGKVAALKDEYQRSVDVLGEDDRKTQDLAIRMNNATAELGKMQSELGDTEEALQNLGDGSEHAADEVEHLDKEQKKATDSGEKLHKVAGTLAGTIKAIAAAALAAVAAVAAMTVGIVALTVGPASDLNETLSKTQVVFEDNAAAIMEFGDQAALSLGMSKNAALTAAATYGNLFRAMGIGTQISADMSIGLVQLAGDLASFNNLDPTEVLDKLRSGLSGETEPLKSLGININQALLQARALELGLWDGKGALDASAKAQAAYSLIMEQTTLAQGDFARTSDGLANQQRIMQAQWENLKATLGTAFLPIVNMATSALNELLSSAEFTEGIQSLVRWLGTLAERMKPVLELVGSFVKQLLQGDISGALTSLFGADNAGMLLNFFAEVDHFIQDVLIPFVTVHAEEIKNALIGIAAVVAVAGIAGAIAGIVAALNPVTLIIAAIAAAIGLLAAAWTGDWGGIRTTMTEIWDNYLKPAFEQLVAWFSVNIPIALQAVSDLWTGTLLPAIQTVWGFLNAYVFPLFAALGDLFGTVFNLQLTIMAGIWQNVLQPALLAVWAFLQDNIFPIFQAIGGYIATTLQPVFNTLSGFLSDKLTPAFDGIGKAIGKVIDWIKDLTKRLKEIKLPAWMTPGSPTPWEIGLIGISDAMADLNKQIPQLQQSLGGAVLGLDGSVSLGGAGNAGSVNNDNRQYNRSYTISNAGVDANELARIQRREDMLYGA